MTDQETQQGGGFSTTTIPGDHHYTTIQTPIPSTAPFTTCTSLKRRPPSSSSHQQPKPKKVTFQPPSSSPAAIEDYDHHLPGFTKLSLPVTPILRRCGSDPINSPGTNDIAAPTTQFSGPLADSGHFLNLRSPENVKINVPATSPSPANETSAPLPPLPPNLRRTVSDPTQFVYQVATTTTPPPQLPSSVEMGTDSIKADSPNAKKLKRMKDIIKEMSQRYEEVMHECEEEEEEEEEEEDFSEDNNSKDESKTEREEAVSVDRAGECLIIHFKCPCGKGYQILLSGTDCYYKLM